MRGKLLHIVCRNRNGRKKPRRTEAALRELGNGRLERVEMGSPSSVEQYSTEVIRLGGGQEGEKEKGQTKGHIGARRGEAAIIGIITRAHTIRAGC